MLQTAARGWHRFMWQPSSLLHSQIGNQLAPGHVLLLSGGHGAPRPSAAAAPAASGPLLPSEALSDLQPPLLLHPADEVD